MKTYLTYIAFVAAVVALGIASGLSNMPGEWYQGLQKPFFNPPSFLFAPVWTVLYVLIGIAGARIWLEARTSAAMSLWLGQMVLNLLWTPVFFGLHRMELGLAVILSLLVLILAFILKAKPVDRLASLLFVP